MSVFTCRMYIYRLFVVSYLSYLTRDLAAVNVNVLPHGTKSCRTWRPHRWLTWHPNTSCTTATRMPTCPSWSSSPQALSSAASADLFEQAIRSAGGVKAGGPPKTDPATGAKRDDGAVGASGLRSIPCGPLTSPKINGIA
ncbi:hypothetical protein Vafri_15793 [Volvox africanus]|uniref:Uncharacterized protein n=1 Tax=Volvox africanus TaxID=51714 RepID=A0A8J4BLW5_9CHLO|nr:hypothetical protein Vafri_15793 [Volvox africanus]